ncbi:potassium channel family protein [Bacillus sp. CHD6a]|uniref:potassium channel family protein n=1 Tax=Bacillus sp. CHD6a TaxID=1643452 RepID=UPI0006CDE8A3|nr:potassium channel family protein [Bacillus sp. CHD6a]KPB04524.1 ion transporter [Bacillus sp. CHD6a]
MWILQRFFKNVVKTNNFAIVFVSILVIAGSSFTMHLLEPDTFPTVFEGLWWTMTTVTTVGYGDVSPQTVAGKSFAMFLFIFGIGLIGVLIGKVVNLFALYSKWKGEGKLNSKKTNHFIFVGWTDKTERAMGEILEDNQNAQIVLIDSKKTNPCELEIDYVQGDASEDAVLLKANVLEAKSVTIFSDDMIEDASLSDGKTLLVASSVERLSKIHNRNIYTIVEIRKEKSIPNFSHANVDEFVISGETASRLLAKATMYHGSTHLFRQLTSRMHGDNIYEIAADPAWITYRQAFHEILDKGATLLSNGKELDINRRLDEKIPSDAKLYIICDKNTYESKFKVG